MKNNLPQRLDDALLVIVENASLESIKRAKLQLSIANTNSNAKSESEEFNRHFHEFMEMDLDLVCQQNAASLLSNVLSGGLFECGVDWERLGYRTHQSQTQ